MRLRLVSRNIKYHGKMYIIWMKPVNSHISAQFVRYCINHKIVLFLLPPYMSHVLQPLDVGVFGSLKTAMARQLSRLLACEISRLQKVKWVDKYISTYAQAISASNIQG